jgi:hypothetical protein
LTRFIWDKLSKDYLETFLSPYGEVKISMDVTTETQEIDVWFVPKTSKIPSELGLLGRLSQTACLFEPYRNPVTLDGILSCLSKGLTVYEQLQREANRQKQRLSEKDIPKLWILTPTASQRIINAFSGQLHPEWGEGIYFLPDALRTAIIVLHQLPETPETLWLRLLGRGGTRNRAIDELESLAPNNPLKSASLKLLYNLSKNLEPLSQTSQEERRFIMRLAPLYEQEREQAFQQGQQQGEAKLVLRQLNRRFDNLPPQILERIGVLNSY